MPDINTAPSDNERAQELARSLDCLTERDLCDLCQITPLTADAWRRRRKGPAYTRVGNSVLYPRASVKAFIESHVREQGDVGAKAVL